MSNPEGDYLRTGPWQLKDRLPEPVLERQGVLIMELLEQNRQLQALNKILFEQNQRLFGRNLDLWERVNAREE